MNRSHVTTHRGSTVRVGSDLYEIHFGRPGKPRVYLRHGRTMRRISADDPVLVQVARAYRAKVDAKKLERVKRARHHLTLRYRFFKWLGRMAAKIRAAFVRAVGVVLDPFGPAE